LNDSRKSKAQLTEELQTLRSRVRDLEQPTPSSNHESPLLTLKNLVAAVPVGLCLLDTELRFVQINEWLAAINGLSVEEHLGRRLSELLPDVGAGVESQFRHVIETGEPIIDGTVVAETPAHPEVKRHFQHSYFPVKSVDGTVVGISCVVQDVTDRKHAEEALKEREQHFRLFSLSTGDCFWNWDMVAGTVERSSGFERAFGYLRQEIGAGIEWWTERIHPKDKQRVSKTFDAAVAGEQSTCGYEYRFRCRDGSYAIVDDHVCLIRDDTGKVVRSLGAMRDITERKQVEENAKKCAVAGARLSLLSPREREVMQLVVAGKTNKAVAQQLGISIKTVEMHRGPVMKKLRVGSVAELVRLVLSVEPFADDSAGS
jgi:PAS domain S-box-containing protein